MNSRLYQPIMGLHVRWLYRLLLPAWLFLAGCGEQEPEPFPVTGTLLIGGQPAEGAMVRFHPVNAGPDSVRPFGMVDAEGRFQLTSQVANDGAMPGDYKVTVEWRPPKFRPSAPDGPDRLQGRYANPETSQISVTIQDQPTTLDPIQLD